MTQLEKAEDDLLDLQFLLEDIYEEVTTSVFTEDENAEDLAAYLLQVEENLALFAYPTKDARILGVFTVVAKDYLDKHKTSIETLCAKYLETINKRCDADAEKYKFELEEC